MEFLILFAPAGLAIVLFIQTGRGLLRLQPTDPVEKRRLKFCRASYLTLLVPLIVTLLFFTLLVVRVSGGPALNAFKSYLTFGAYLWVAASILGIVLAIAASFPLKRCGQGLALIGIHLLSLFLIYAAKYAAVGPYPS